MKGRALNQIMLGTGDEGQTNLDLYSIADLANTEQTSKADQIRQTQGIFYAGGLRGARLAQTAVYSHNHAPGC